MKLLLVGYRATGKTSAGFMLSERLGVGFVDTDQLIQEQAGKSVSEIVAESGWEGFRALERGLLDQVIRQKGDAVISCGGGAVLHEEIFNNLPHDVKAVWLRASVDTIVRRINKDSASEALRPSLTEEATLEDEVRRVLSERERLYSRASQFQVDTDALGLDEIVDRLEEIWRKESI